MKIKTSELTGAALDWAVTICEGWSVSVNEFMRSQQSSSKFAYSTVWAKGGPIVEREDINVNRYTHSEVTEGGQEIYRKDGWTAFTTATGYWITPTRQYGPTPLIAAMRCRVASKLGNEIDVPEELL